MLNRKLVSRAVVKLSTLGANVKMTAFVNAFWFLEMQWLVRRTRKRQWRGLYGCNLVKYLWIFVKCILQFRQIHFEIRTNIFCTLDKYIMNLPYAVAGQKNKEGTLEVSGVQFCRCRPHLSDAHLVISFCPSASNLVRGGHIWSLRWRGSSEMEPLCHCLTV